MCGEIDEQTEVGQDLKEHMRVLARVMDLSTGEGIARAACRLNPVVPPIWMPSFATACPAPWPISPARRKTKPSMP